MQRNIIGVTRIHVGPDIRSHEETLLKKDSFVCRIGIRSRSFGMDMVEVQVLQLPGVSPPAEGGNQGMRHIGDAAQVDMVVRLHELDGLVGGHIVYRIHVCLQVHRPDQGNGHLRRQR